ncbi:hypothetical protein G7Y79_00004g014030 [Physcia stellaris]|nr:hypothetical protein G7Y79_00004g014030 [Physcia stellaris]
MPHGMQPQSQPPFENTRNAPSDRHFDGSAAASKQPNHTKSVSHNLLGHDQGTTPDGPLNANTNLYNDSKTNDSEYSLQYAQAKENAQPLSDANLQQPNSDAKNSQSYDPVPPGNSPKGREIHPPSHDFTKEDLAIKGPLQSPEAFSTGTAIGSDREELAYKPREPKNRGIAPDHRSVQRGLLNEAISRHAETGQPQEKTLLTTRPRFSAPQEETVDDAVGPGLQRPSSQQSIINRVSEDSYNTFHTAADGDRSRPNSGSVTELLATPRAEKPQFFGPGETVLVNSEKGTPPSVLPPTSDFSIFHVHNGAQEQGNGSLPDRYAIPSDIHPNPAPTRHADLAREPSLDNIDSQIESDRSPSPVSPQLSIHNEPIRRQSTREPIYYGPQHDFGVKQTRNPARRQSRPSSQSGEDISLQGHPAFRTPTSSDQQHTSPVSDDANGSGQRTLGFHPEENKSPTVRPARTKSRSDRNSRNSGFFKNLGSSGKVGVPSIVSAAETQPPPPSNMNATESDKKSKRGSLFRSRAGDKGDDETRGTAGSSAPITTTQQGSPATSKSSQLEEAPSNDPNTSRTKLQRASTSGNKVAEGGGKKKRFSAIGSLFGRRSSRSQPSPAVQASQPQPGPSYTSIPVQRPQPQTSYPTHRPLAEQSRSQQLSDYSRAPLGDSAPHQPDYSSPSRSDTFASQTSTPAWGQTAQRVSQTRQTSLKEPSAYVQDSALRQKAMSPPINHTSGSARTSTSFSQNTQSGTSASKPRTSFFSRSKSRESSIVGRNRDSSGNSWMTNKAQYPPNPQGNSFAGRSKPISSTHSVQPSAQASSPETKQGSQRILTFSQFGESHITTTREQDQRDSQGQPVHQQSQQAFNPRPPRTTSLGFNAPPTGPPRVLTFNQFGESYIAGNPSRSTAAPPTSEQSTTSQPQQHNVVTFHQFPSESNAPQSSRRSSPPPPPPPPKDDWHVAKPRGSSSQQPQANTVEQKETTPSKTFTATPSSYPDPRRTSQTQHQAQGEQRQAPPPLQTDIPSPRLGAFSPEKTSAESRKARQRELEFVPSTEKETASAPVKPDMSSEENIVMSSSSYPGQEWQPSYAYDD